MESLIELVAVSLARHGIACPDGAAGWKRSASLACAQQGRSVEADRVPTSAAGPTLPNTLPEHSFRRKSNGELAP
jgi:hypothetical protein